MVKALTHRFVLILLLSVNFILFYSIHFTLGMVGRFPGDDPRLGDFQSDWLPILCDITI